MHFVDTLKFHGGQRKMGEQMVLASLSLVPIDIIGFYQFNYLDQSQVLSCS